MDKVELRDAWIISPVIMRVVRLALLGKNKIRVSPCPHPHTLPLSWSRRPLASVAFGRGSDAARSHLPKHRSVHPLDHAAGVALAEVRIALDHG